MTFPLNNNFTCVNKSIILCPLPEHEFVGTTNMLNHYPEVNIHCDLFNTSNVGYSLRAAETMRNVLVPVDEGVFKRITRTFFESGLLAALNEARNPSTNAAHPFVSLMAEYINNSWQIFAHLKAKLFPNTIGQNTYSIENNTETRNWSRSLIRYIAWHPNCFKIAVAGLDDSIRIYTDESAIVPLLKAANQKSITSMAWRPFTAGELAAGCEQGICVWSVDGNMSITRCSAHSVFLKHANHFPVVAVQWSSCGTLLASSALGDKNVIIWDIDRKKQTPLKCVGLPCSVLKWSPNGSCLFSGTVGGKFRIWYADRQWVPQRYHLQHKSIQSACWSSCSSHLLFVTTEDELLYRLDLVQEVLFKENDVAGSITPIANLAKMCIGNREIGGRPQSLAWDADCRYLAVSFKNSSSIAIFETVLNKLNLSLSAAFTISAISAEYPSFICFQSKTRKHAIPVLTIGWSSGRIQYFPFMNL